MMGYYEAKFLREQQEHPIDWIIAPALRGTYKLVYIGPPPGVERKVATVGEETSVPYLRVVK
jgi:hypothetical protein